MDYVTQTLVLPDNFQRFESLRKYPLFLSFSESQGGAVLLQEANEDTPTLERGPTTRPTPSTDDLAPEREREAERERPDSETESDVDDP